MATLARTVSGARLVIVVGYQGVNGGAGLGDDEADIVGGRGVAAVLGEALVEAGDQRGRAHGRARGVAQVGEVAGDALGAEHHVGLVEQLGEAVAAVGEQHVRR